MQPCVSALQRGPCRLGKITKRRVTIEAPIGFAAGTNVKGEVSITSCWHSDLFLITGRGLVLNDCQLDKFVTLDTCQKG